jgi:hypothetical protein
VIKANLWILDAGYRLQDTGRLSLIARKFKAEGICLVDWLIE